MHLFSSRHLRRFGRNRLQEEFAMLPLKNKPNILSLVHRRLPCLSAAKLMRLTHTQGRDELPSEITK